VITVFLRPLTQHWGGKLIAVIVSGYDRDGAAAQEVISMPRQPCCDSDAPTADSSAGPAVDGRGSGVPRSHWYNRQRESHRRPPVERHAAENHVGAPRLFSWMV